MNITPTPLSAALAGLFSALLLPVLWSHFGGSGSADSIGLVVGFLLVVALPAHAFVLGFGRSQVTNPRTLDTALLKRIAAWLVAVAATVAVAEFLKAQ
ncbi:hypothetical protein SAMN05216303_10226 [Rhodoferax sp. OV413]|uniref:hypothetical protein n=1 Tax=Rhodoferax sp. OV413 TaxID=1855285 RepID=UPI0008863E47|nr:hypothetical protein [Rhodoferax sp. OV413]SDO65808.1 hypothetical protein SAMN05216303_10226 [Rhodoferax sp. OV413]